MLVINYHPTTGQAIPDGDVESFILSNLSRRGSRDVVLTVSTENVVLVARALIAEGFINNSRIRIFWNGMELAVDNDGRILNWDSSMSSVLDATLNRLLNARRQTGEVEESFFNPSLTTSF